MSANALPRPMPASPAWVFGGLQLVLGLSWAVYALFLPQLVVAAGLPRSLVPWLLVLDQLIFALTDPLAGAASDRAAAHFRQIGVPVVCLTAGSGLAFGLMPFASLQGSPAFLATLLLVWAFGTAALRAPLAALLSRYQPDSDAPHAALITAGMALSGVAGGLLIPAIREASALAAFAWVGLGSALVALLVIPAERWLGGEGRDRGVATAAPAPAPASSVNAPAIAGAPASVPRQAPAPASLTPLSGLYLAAALLALGQQLFVFVGSSAVFGKSVPPIVPSLFFVGAALAFGLIMVLRRRFEPAVLLRMSAGAGAVAVAGFATLESLGGRAVLNGLAGLAWGLALSVLFARAFALGRETGRPGRVVGGLFALLALGSLLRIASGALGWWTGPGPQAALWATALAWLLVAGIGLNRPAWR